MTNRAVLLVLGFLCLGLAVGSTAAVGANPVGGGDQTLQTADTTFQQTSDNQSEGGGELNDSLLAPADQPFIVEGEVRDSRLGPEPFIFSGETLRSEVRVHNEGDVGKAYDVSMATETAVLDSAQGELDPGEETTVEVGAPIETPGDFDITIAGESTTVTVVPRDRALVTNLTVTKSADSESITVTATVLGGPAANESDIEIYRGVTEADAALFYRDNVTLDPGEETTIERTVPAPGEFTSFYADGQTESYFWDPDVDVDASKPENETTGDGGGDERNEDESSVENGSTAADDKQSGDSATGNAPGFGISVAMLGTLAVGAARLWRVGRSRED
jgi:hypothetical protein